MVLVDDFLYFIVIYYYSWVIINERVITLILINYIIKLLFNLSGVNYSVFIYLIFALTFYILFAFRFSLETRIFIVIHLYRSTCFLLNLMSIWMGKKLNFNYFLNLKPRDCTHNKWLFPGISIQRYLAKSTPLNYADLYPKLKPCFCHRSIKIFLNSIIEYFYRSVVFIEFSSSRNFEQFTSKGVLIKYVNKNFC